MDIKINTSNISSIASALEASMAGEKITPKAELAPILRGASLSVNDNDDIKRDNDISRIVARMLMETNDARTNSVKSVIAPVQALINAIGAEHAKAMKDLFSELLNASNKEAEIKVLQASLAANPHSSEAGEIRNRIALLQTEVKEHTANPANYEVRDLNRLARGGGYYSQPSNLRSAARNDLSASLHSAGFRLAALALPNYYVIDLLENSDSYPVTALNDVPEGGWTDEYKTNKLVLRRIPSGKCTEGSGTDEKGRVNIDTTTTILKDTNESTHLCILTEDFYIGVFEVTQKQWELVMWDDERKKKPSFFTNSSCYATRPVESIEYVDLRGTDKGKDWPDNDDVDEDSFLGRLRKRVAILKFDLPTEAQWEYACRAGTTTALNSGKDLSTEDFSREMEEVGRYYFNSGKGTYPSDSDLSTGTAAVGSYKPNAWGLYDMHGNVWEWCLDRYAHQVKYGYDDWETDPRGPTASEVVEATNAEETRLPLNVTTTSRVYRGGSYQCTAKDCRSARRMCKSPSGNNYPDFGFRLKALPIGK